MARLKGLRANGIKLVLRTIDGKYWGALLTSSGQTIMETLDFDSLPVLKRNMARHFKPHIEAGLVEIVDETE